MHDSSLLIYWILRKSKKEPGRFRLALLKPKKVFRTEWNGSLKKFPKSDYLLKFTLNSSSSAISGSECSLFELNSQTNLCAVGVGTPFQNETPSLLFLSHAPPYTLNSVGKFLSLFLILRLHSHSLYLIPQTYPVLFLALVLLLICIPQASTISFLPLRCEASFQEPLHSCFSRRTAGE